MSSPASYEVLISGFKLPFIFIVLATGTRTPFSNSKSRMLYKLYGEGSLPTCAADKRTFVKVIHEGSGLPTLRMKSENT